MPARANSLPLQVFDKTVSGNNGNDKYDNLPSTPPKAHFVPFHFKDAQDGARLTSAGDDIGDNTIMARRHPWWRRYAGYHKLKVLSPRGFRRRLGLIAMLAFVLLVVIVAWLFESGRVGGKTFQISTTASIRLPQGTYIGQVLPLSDKMPRSIEAFRGIPYAQTTGGDNRFRPPQAMNLNNPDKVFPATDFGFVCLQGGTRDQDEDCLNLNLFRPHFGNDPAGDAADMAKLGGDGKKPLPVMIYVPGGGFNGGAGKERSMSSFVSWADVPMIGISFNYRLGALGFPSSGLAERAGVLNLGLKDQQMLFSWVQQNVATFGGDPNNVTIVGLSAGAHSVGHQLLSYAPANRKGSQPVPFQKAIMESGGPTARSVFAATHPLYESQFEEFLAKCGVNSTSEGDVFDTLRKLPINTVISASRSVWNKYYASLRWAFQPVIDGPGGVIPDLPIRLWEKGDVLRIPIITGFDTNEGTIFVPTKPSNPTALRDLMSPLIPALNETSLTTMEQIYPDPSTPAGQKMYVTNPPAGFGREFWRLDDAYAHYAYICPVFQTAHFTSFTDAPVYVYQFAARSGAHNGADHGDEAPIVSHDMSVIAGLPGLMDAADAMTGAWSRFAAFGDPNHALPGQHNEVWSQFYSPFPSSTGEVAGNGAKKGVITVFADGNDERIGLSGRQHDGIPQQMRNMTTREHDSCQFWWDRVVYSEGFGNGSLAFQKRDFEYPWARL